MMNATTMNTALEDVLKGELTSDLFVEGTAMKVYDKIAGLPNIGKTYFVNWNEISKANEYARNKLMQEWGNEVFGKSAQNTGQSTNGTASNTGTGAVIKEASGSTGPLIDCQVDFLMDIQTEKKTRLDEAGNGTYERFIKTVNDFQKYVQKKVDEDPKWKHSHERQLKDLNDAVKGFKNMGGPNVEENLKAWNKLYEVFNYEPWKGEVTGKDKEMKRLADAIMAEWRNWGGESSTEFGKGIPLKDKNGDRGKEKDNAWYWWHTYRIDIRTNFNDDWYKKTFKSGLINAFIRAVKTDARAHTSQDAKTQWTNHKYTYDEMLPQEKKKLDSLQWKMTNKVAYSFLTSFLGWSRDKEKYIDESTGKPLPKQGVLDIDEKLGKSLAKSAMGDRGLWGRFKQKMFSGGQANNVISLSFQLADPEDGWKLVDEETGEEIDTGGEDGNPDGGTGGSGDGTDGAGGKGGTGGKEGGNPGSGGSSNLSLSQRLTRAEDKLTDNNLWGNIEHPQRSNIDWGKVGESVEHDGIRAIVESCRDGDLTALVDEILIESLF